MSRSAVVALVLWAIVFTAVVALNLFALALEAGW